MKMRTGITTVNALVSRLAAFVFGNAIITLLNYDLIDKGLEIWTIIYNIPLLAFLIICLFILTLLLNIKNKEDFQYAMLVSFVFLGIFLPGVIESTLGFNMLFWYESWINGCNKQVGLYEAAIPIITVIFSLITIAFLDCSNSSKCSGKHEKEEPEKLPKEETMAA